MLKDELELLTKLVNELTILDWSANDKRAFDELHGKIVCECQRVRKLWSLAYFSDTKEQSLKRYFYFHLEGIRELSDTLFTYSNLLGDMPVIIIATELILLIDYLRIFFKSHFNYDCYAPKAFTKKITDDLSSGIYRLLERISSARPDPSLLNLLQRYFGQLTENNGQSVFSFRFLIYYQLVYDELNALPINSFKEADVIIIKKLLELNFNHLDFFSHCRIDFYKKCAGMCQKEKIEQLNLEKATLRAMPVSSIAYDPAWPSIHKMLHTWLSEEIISINEQLKIVEDNVQIEKLPLNLSVAHLAILIRLFVEEKLFRATNLSFIFNFVSAHYETVRQKTISPGSLSKEYYSTNQVTAAVVRDILLKMVSQINRTFFPVLVVASTIIHYFSAIV